MQFLIAIGVIILGYLLGSIPSGVIVVYLFTRKDIRKIESGRTGGTNAIRAAGYFAGLLTAVLDLLKAFLAVLIAKSIMPENYWLHVLAPVAAVIGHNFSIFLIERNEQGRVRLRGGAGGAPSLGGSAGLWFPSLLILLPILLLIWLVIGYASLATLSVGIFVTLLFGYLAWIGFLPWQYIFYGVFIELILVWALRPNIKRLLNGTERLVGLRARNKKEE
jgi:glycerol-3-phosphate acyltransferase PlsY